MKRAKQTRWVWIASETWLDRYWKRKPPTDCHFVPCYRFIHARRPF